MKKKHLLAFSLSLAFILSSCGSATDTIKSATSEISDKAGQLSNDISNSSDDDFIYESFHKYVDISNYINDVLDSKAFLSLQFNPEINYDLGLTPFDLETVNNIKPEIEAEEHYKDLSEITLKFYPDLPEFIEKSYDLNEYVMSGGYKNDNGTLGKNLVNDLNGLYEKIMIVDEDFYPLYLEYYDEYDQAYIDLYKEQGLNLSYNTSMFLNAVDDFNDYLDDYKYTTETIQNVDYEKVKDFEKDIETYYKASLEYFDEKTVAEEGFSPDFFAYGKESMTNIYNSTTIMFDAIKNNKPLPKMSEEAKYTTDGTMEKLDYDYSDFIYYYNLAQ